MDTVVFVMFGAVISLCVVAWVRGGFPTVEQGKTALVTFLGLLAGLLAGVVAATLLLTLLVAIKLMWHLLWTA